MKMSKDEKAETRAFFTDLSLMFQPPKPRALTMGQVIEKFCSLSNHKELIARFEEKHWERDEFCDKFKCGRWVYDFLLEMSQRNKARMIIEKKLSGLHDVPASNRIPSRKVKPGERALRREDFNEPTMMVVINCWDPTKLNGQSLYDATRGYWHVGASGKAYRCRYVVASYFGRVMEVYEVNQNKSWMNWEQSPKKTNPDDKPASKMRRAFEGNIAPDEVRARYIGRSTSGLILPRMEKVYLGFN